MPALANSADVLGRVNTFLGDCILSPTVTALTMFRTNEVDLRAGTGRTFVSYVTYSNGGPQFPLAMAFGTGPVPNDWGTGLDLSTRDPGPGVFYAPQGAPIYGNGVPFAAQLVSVTGFTGAITFTAYGFYW